MCFQRGTTWGVAPKARIAMYKACNMMACYPSDIVAAIDAAVSDGVDIVSMMTESLMGKVVVCNYGGSGVKSGVAAQCAGAAGIVDVGFYERFLDGVDGQMFTLPGVTLGYTKFKMLEAYMAWVPYPVASFRFTCDTVTDENRAPTVTGFSSRGANTLVPEILKPDVIAPGVNILAAWSGDAPPSDSE